VDDSDFEANLIRQLLPEVEVLRVPSDTGVEHRSLLASCGWFDTLTLSAEDRERGAAYQAEAERQRLRVGSDDLETYYRSLEMVPEIRLADPLTIPRIAQLTQKTNQFNLTTRRYSDEEISRLAASGTADVIWLRLRDRFGDAGIVGVCILRYEDRQAIFDTLLLSCRVLGRGVEDAFMAHCLQRAANRGCDLAVGEYRPTQKNGQVSDFYQRRGFAPLPGDGDGQRFTIELPADLEAPGFFARIESELVP
jgi:FkbH-like protein